jgi:hypothetical protein
MVNYKNLITGKKYKLGDIKVGKFVRLETEANGDNVLIFLDSQYGDKGENTIYPDDQDDFIEMKSKDKTNTSKNRTKGGTKRRTKRKFRKR